MKNPMSLACEEAPARDRQNLRRLRVSLLTWGATFLIVTLAATRDWLGPAWLEVAAILLCTTLGGAALLRYGRYVREADELRRKIEVDSSGYALGVGVLAGLTYFLLDATGFVGETEVLHLVTLMLLTKGAAEFLLKRRYA
ncbi:MAG TPA: hypothetical protein VKU85_12025 [bacterium]|nr:hypothetical protein [bacterium]